MFSLGKPTITFFLNSKSLLVIEIDKEGQQNLFFTSASVLYSEVIDENKYKNELQEFIAKLNIGGRKGIVILSKELVFDSEVDITGKIEKDEVEKILAKIPLERVNISMLPITEKNKVRVIATNKKLYTLLLEVLKNNNVEVIAVTPGGEVFNQEEAKKIVEQKEVYEKYNFLKTS